jgi:peroxiredoxin
MMTRRGRILWVVALMAVGPHASNASTSPPGLGASTPSQRLAFKRAVLNVEVERAALARTVPAGVAAVAGTRGDVYFGVIERWTQAADGRALESPVAFEVEYAGGIPSRAWCDTDLDGRLDDETPLKLWSYPEPEGSRSFLVDLTWASRAGTAPLRVSWKVRVAMAPTGRSDDFPAYRVQQVEGMSGTVTLEGRTHRVFLFDGSNDGLYTHDTGDGLFVDLEDSGRPAVDMFSPGFGPFSVPFQIGTRVYRVEDIDPEGKALTLLEIGQGMAGAPPLRGAPAPDFAYQDVDGRQVRLQDHRGRWVVVYFWASWCGTTRALAPGMRELYSRFNSRGVDALGVSFDKDWSSMEAFRQQAELIWPTSFSGHAFYEDPIGRLYQVRAVPAMFLVDPEGRLEGTYNDPSALSAHLEALLALRG